MGGEIAQSVQVSQPVVYAQPIQVQSLFNDIGKVDLQSGNTSNFNKPLGDGYNIHQLVREGGSTVNFGSGMSTSNQKQILDKAIAGDKQELGNTSWYNFPRQRALNSGITQTQNQENNLFGLLLI